MDEKTNKKASIQKFSLQYLNENGEWVKIEPLTSVRPIPESKFEDEIREYCRQDCLCTMSAIEALSEIRVSFWISFFRKILEAIRNFFRWS
jgi:hypothetical protein